MGFELLKTENAGSKRYQSNRDMPAYRWRRREEKITTMGKRDIIMPMILMSGYLLKGINGGAAIRDSLSKSYPDEKAAFEKNAAAYITGCVWTRNMKI